MSEAASDSATVWRKCSPCKKPIEYAKPYYVCSVSTCNGQRTGYVFCSVACWETHVPGARHRDAAAVEMTAPTRAQATALGAAAGGAEAPAPRAPQRVLASVAPSRPASASIAASGPREVLVIASRLKEFIDARSGGYNTSQSVMDVLSDHLRDVCDRAIDNARVDGRKTVMDRDFAWLKGTS